MVQWLVCSGLGGEGSIVNTLSGDDVEQAIYLHKLMFKAILRMKIKHCNYFKNSLSIETKELLKDFQIRVNFETLLELVNCLKPIELIPGDMSNWIELYLELYLSTGNWDGFLQALKKFIPFFFALNRHNYVCNMWYYYIKMLNLQESHPSIYEYLTNGGFTTSVSGLKNQSSLKHGWSFRENRKHCRK